MQPWLAARLPLETFPVNGRDRPIAERFAEDVIEFVSAEERFAMHLYLQTWKLMGTPGAEVLADHVGDWWPVMGCGIWPDREPPRAWTEEAMSDAGAAYFRGEEVPLTSHKLLRVSVDPQRLPSVAARMQGFGGVLAAFSLWDTLAWEARLRAEWLPTVTAKRFQNEKFYIPLLDLRSLGSAGSAAQLEAWVGEASVYLRESAEDRALLMFWRADHLPAMAAWLEKEFCGSPREETATETGTIIAGKLQQGA